MNAPRWLVTVVLVLAAIVLLALAISLIDVNVKG